MLGAYRSASKAAKAFDADLGLGPALRRSPNETKEEMRTGAFTEGLLGRVCLRSAISTRVGIGPCSPTCRSFEGVASDNLGGLSRHRATLPAAQVARPFHIPPLTYRACPSLLPVTNFPCPYSAPS